MEIVMKQYFFILLVIAMRRCDGCLEKERIALLEIKYFFNHSSFLSDWGLRNVDCCNWGCVGCNETTNRVISLDLGGLRDQSIEKDWYLNASLFLPFQQLKNLSLYGYNFNGCIENEGFEKLSKLSNLELLDLGGNNFNNSILPSISDLSSLKYLYLSSNRLEGTTNISELNNLKSLEKLDLSGNSNITKFVGTTDEIGLSKLSALYLEEMIIDGRSQLLKSLSIFSSIKVLDLSYSNFSDGASFGSPGSYNWSNLEKLYLDNSFVDENFFLSIEAAMPSLKLLSCTHMLNPLIFKRGSLNFKYLELLYMDSSTIDSSSFLRDIGMMRNLKTLSLPHCGLKVSIPDRQGQGRNQDFEQAGAETACLKS